MLLDFFVCLFCVHTICVCVCVCGVVWCGVVWCGVYVFCFVFSSMCSFLNASLALAYDTFTLFLPAKVPRLASFSFT